MAQFSIRMQPSLYALDLNALRNHLETQGQLSSKGRTGDLAIDLYPPGATTPVELLMDTSNLYIVGFKGAGRWYYFEGEARSTTSKKEKKGVEMSLGGDYVSLGGFGEITLASLGSITQLSSQAKGSAVDTSLIVMVTASVSEALRFATVATYFTGLINSVIPSINLARLKVDYFNKWEDHQEANRGEALLKS